MFFGLKAKLTSILDNSTAKEVTASEYGNKVALDTILASHESTLNSSSDALTASSTFTGTSETNGMPQVGTYLLTDQDGTLYFQFSPDDGTTWKDFPTAGFEVAANIPEFHTAVKLPRPFRVKFVNGDDGAQTFLYLKTYFGYDFIPSNTPLNQSISTDNDAIVTRTTDSRHEIMRGLVSGASHNNKFAFRSGLTATAGEETIWATTGNHTIITTASTFTIAYDDTQDGSAQTGARTIQISYIDANGLNATLNHTLGSSSPDVTTVTGLGINRTAVTSTGGDGVNNADITITATTGGTVQAIVPAGLSVTQQAIFHVDANSWGSLEDMWVNSTKAGGGSAKVGIKGYVYNRTVGVTFEIYRATLDTSSDSGIPPPGPFRLSPADVLYFVADTDTNSAGVNVRFNVIEYKIS